MCICGTCSAVLPCVQYDRDDGARNGGPAAPGRRGGGDAESRDGVAGAGHRSTSGGCSLVFSLNRVSYVCVFVSCVVSSVRLLLLTRVIFVTLLLSELGTDRFFFWHRVYHAQEGRTTLSPYSNSFPQETPTPAMSRCHCGDLRQSFESPRVPLYYCVGGVPGRSCGW